MNIGNIEYEVLASEYSGGMTCHKVGKISDKLYIFVWNICDIDYVDRKMINDPVCGCGAFIGSSKEIIQEIKNCFNYDDDYAAELAKTLIDAIKEVRKWTY